jgi:hypothetical protein
VSEVGDSDVIVPLLWRVHLLLQKSSLQHVWQGPATLFKLSCSIALHCCNIKNVTFIFWYSSIILEHVILQYNIVCNKHASIARIKLASSFYKH